MTVGGAGRASSSESSSSTQDEAERRMLSVTWEMIGVTESREENVFISMGFLGSIEGAFDDRKSSEKLDE